MELLIEGFTGSVLKNLSKEYLVNLQIPIPKSEQKIQEWVDKISKPYDEKNSKQNRIKELEEYVQNKIKDITDNEECDEVELGSLCEIKSGNHTTKKSDFKEGPYLVIGGGINPICSHNEYNCEENTILCASHGTVGLINMYPIKTFLTMCFGLVVKNNDNKMYIYNYLKFINKEIINLGNGSTLKCMTKIALSKIKIKIPKNKQHIRDLEPAFEEIEKLQGEVREAETLYNNLIKELSDEAMPKTSEIIELTKDNVDTFEEITEVKEEKEPSIKSSVASSVASGTSIKSLKEQCKSLGIKGYSNKKKEELIKLIENHK
jgi:restriction endonuclease S subunit